MKRFVVFALLIGGPALAADYPQPASTDRWWDIINTNGKVIWLDQDRIWQEGQRSFGVVRIVIGNGDFRDATDVIVATDCRLALKAFGTYENFRTAQLDPVQGMGRALMRGICR